MAVTLKMNYLLRRGNEEYGPYTLADLRRFAFSGNVAPTDEVRPEADAGWQPARLVLGSDAWPVPASPAPAATIPQAPPGAYLPAYQVPVMANGAPLPIDFHWALLLLVTFLTCGMAGYVWLLVQAWWVRKLDPRSNAIWLLIGYIAIGYAAIIPNIAMSFTGSDSMDALSIALFALVMAMSLGSLVLYLVGIFSMRRSMNDYFQHVENIGLHLGPFMTFFFAPYYFQYHMSRIARWKKTGILA